MTVHIAGEITECTDFAPLLAIDAREVVIDLAEVTRINSSGVRLWIRFVRALAGGPRGVVLDRCSVAIVHQLTMVASFREGAGVRSVFVPYLCPACGNEDTRLTDVARIAGTIAAPATCTACGAMTEFDDVPEIYLALGEPTPAAPHP